MYTTTLSAPIMTNKVYAPQLMGSLLLAKLHKTQINYDITLHLLVQHKKVHSQALSPKGLR